MVPGMMIDPEIHLVTDISASEVRFILYSSFYDLVFVLKFRTFISSLCFIQSVTTSSTGKDILLNQYISVKRLW